MNKQEELINLLKQMPALGQRQDSTQSQLEDLVMVANKLGLYDAADTINRTFIERPRMGFIK